MRSSGSGGGLEFDELIAEFPAVKTHTYLDTASESLLPQSSVRAMFDYFRARRTELHPQPPDDREIEQDLRKTIADLVSGDPDEVALCINTSLGLNLCAQALPRGAGSNVVVPWGEFPSNVYPWLNLKHQGVEVRLFKPRGDHLTVEEFEPQIDERTIAVAVSFVDFKKGDRIDLGALSRVCHAKGSVLVVDGMQGLGVVPLSVRECGIDVLASGGSKWLLSPKGTGFLYCSREVQERLGQPMAGWKRVKGQDPTYFRVLDYRFSLYDDTSRFEIGTLPIPNYTAMLNSLKLMRRIGVDTIWKHVQPLRRRLIEGLAERGIRVASSVEPDRGSGIVSFYAGAPQLLAQRLKEERVHVSAREGVVRVSLHLYNRAEDVDRLLEWIDKLGELVRPG